MSPIRFVMMLLCLSLVFLSCESMPEVNRINPDEIRDLSGGWNDTDSRLVAEEMIDQILSANWITEHTMRTGKKPFVLVDNIINRAHDHINVKTFIWEIEKVLINSGKVRFVASREERDRIRKEREDMDLHAREDTRKAMGQEIGADYLLLGEINSIIDSAGRQQVRYYQVNLELISMTDNVKVWIGQKKIKKAVKNSKIRY